MDLHRDTSLHQQRDTLQSLLSQVDAEWETLTRALQADRQILASLQVRQQHLFFLLHVELPPSPSCTQALLGHLAAVEQHMRQVSQEISHKECQRRTLEYRFEETRRALSALQRQEGKQHWMSHLAGIWLRPLLMKRLLRALWGDMHTAGIDGHSCRVTGPEEVQRETMRKFLL